MGQCLPSLACRLGSSLLCYHEPSTVACILSRQSGPILAKRWLVWSCAHLFVSAVPHLLYQIVGPRGAVDIQTELPKVPEDHLVLGGFVGEPLVLLLDDVEEVEQHDQGKHTEKFIANMESELYGTLCHPSPTFQQAGSSIEKPNC